MTDSRWSVPESKVYARARELLDAEKRAVLATVIDVEGNAYRRPGAKMLVTPDGDGVGSVTAGCLEDQISRLAADVLSNGQPRVETYDMMEDDDDIWGLGVGCNGVIDVLLEPLTERHRPAFDAIEANEPVGIVTVLKGDVPTGSRINYRPGHGISADKDTPKWLHSAVEPEARSYLDQERSGVVSIETDEGRVEVFIDALTPAPKLVIVGSGHDVRPVTELATNVDFRVHVISYRGITSSDSFPTADTVSTTSPAQIGDEISFDENTYVVVMTHNFVDDQITLEQLLQTPVPYIGLMGPRKRFRELQEAMADEESIEPPTETGFDRIYTPIGLDLGGGTPYQIAHSIVAELMAVANNRDPKHLSDREGAIHSRSDDK
ncbi:XdhC family protein [Natronomonas salina]|uniref:XdhC family protein n=1 Tax=Natronomonas salina TaxID=1710540 RepID=UPI0015B41FEA|nr:XdhC/CoxI family protein [Natronomonas salina]QLD89126.1 XdhC family protein [Natronomonas salina]